MNINPELIKYFKDSSDAEKIRPYSHKCVEFRCPLCGKSKSTYDSERNRLEWEYVFNNNKKGGNNSGI